MRSDRVLIPVLHVAHSAKCFSPFVYSYFNRQLSGNFILSKNCQCLGCMSIKKRGCGFNQKRGLAETDS